MAKEHAEQFLAKMVADPELKARIKAGYRRMLCDLARQEGLEVSAEDLQLALLEEKYRLADEDLAGVAGGQCSERAFEPYGGNTTPCQCIVF